MNAYQDAVSWLSAAFLVLAIISAGLRYKSPLPRQPGAPPTGVTSTIVALITLGLVGFAAGCSSSLSESTLAASILFYSYLRLGYAHTLSRAHFLKKTVN